MLLNWNTINTCFLSSTFQVRSSAGFAGVCISSFLLVVLLEFLRRLQRNLDHTLRVHQATRREHVDAKELQEFNDEELLLEGRATQVARQERLFSGFALDTIAEQVARGLVHMLQFAISYCIMLLVMYSNGELETKNSHDTAYTNDMYYRLCHNFNTAGCSSWLLSILEGYDY